MIAVLLLAAAFRAPVLSLPEGTKAIRPHVQQVIHCRKISREEVGCIVWEHGLRRVRALKRGDHLWVFFPRKTPVKHPARSAGIEREYWPELEEWLTPQEGREIEESVEEGLKELGVWEG
jgi:hypothetical protein